MPRSRNSLEKAALATAISIAVGSAYADAVPRSKFRLTLDDEISSRPDTPTTAEFDGRISVNALIQSHPDPLYLALEERYEALPPFTMAEEEIPGQLIAEASVRERVADRIRDIATDVRTFVPTISARVSQDNINDELDGSEQLMIASINPTFEYKQEQRRWALNATYDLDHKQYYGDRNQRATDHIANVDYKLKINRESELNIGSIVSRTHDFQARDPIRDFDTNLQSEELEFDRTQLSVTYKNGTEQDRSRYNVYFITEQSDLSGLEFLDSGYELDRHAVGGSYVWRARRQLALVAEGRFQSFDYDLPYRDNNHTQAMIGTDLVLARRMKTRLRIGYESKDFEEGLTGTSFGEPVWKGTLEWALRRSTTVKVETGREIYELADASRPIDSGRFNVRDWLSAAWRERWSDRLSTEATLTYRDTNVKGAEDIGETAHQVIISAVYQFSEKVQFALDGAFTREDSDRNNDFSRRTFTFRTDYSL